MLKGKKILIGVTASIAAYKVAYLVRILKKENAEVKVVMTPSAFDFITPLTLSVLSGNPVLSTFSSKEDGTWNNHVELGLWADVMVIAPASANTMSKMANGACDNLMMAVYLSAKCPVLFAPAMDLDMYKHPATLENIAKLKSFGNKMIQPGYGELASGLFGEGRMAEPEEIVEHIELQLSEKKLKGKKALVSAGPTYEAIDPVRFIGNHSSGKMGVAIAEELARNGADVTLVMGPSNITSKVPGITTVHVLSSEDMFKVCDEAFVNADIAVMAAAVADYTPTEKAAQKIKKKEIDLSLQLTKTKDILMHLGTIKKASQVLVGFALETENGLENATEKVKRKNADFIVLNSLTAENKGFGVDFNKVQFIDNNSAVEAFESKSKKEVATDIVSKIAKIIKSK
ncbi:MAG: bifunctional phosphopantothenoylcysteine decarboxylase/phosphopantothenate--cysteine ligase CoaBC [Bacteroidetes bacterium]|nr:bifunctional phosphopantothenoylcysteine decarboxylase/phosphopantothenate--cysteine ligase CoaBC [Bacteroidota bacterium]